MTASTTITMLPPTMMMADVVNPVKVSASDSSISTANSTVVLDDDFSFRSSGTSTISSNTYHHHRQDRSSQDISSLAFNIDDSEDSSSEEGGGENSSFNNNNRSKSPPPPPPSKGTATTLSAIIQEMDQSLSNIVTTTVTKEEVVSEQAPTASSSSSSSENRKSSVRFDTIEFREYQIGIGAGIPSSGAPLGITWSSISSVTIPLEDYESLRPEPRRRGHQMVLPSAQRTDMLLNSGVSMTEIRASTNTCDKIRKDRNASANTMLLKLHLALNSAGKKLSFFNTINKKGTSKKVSSPKTIKTTRARSA